MTLTLYYIATLAKCYVIAATSEAHAEVLGKEYLGDGLKTVRPATRDDVELHGIGIKTGEQK